jgi:hypothetical protein
VPRSVAEERHNAAVDLHRPELFLIVVAEPQCPLLGTEALFHERCAYRVLTCTAADDRAVLREAEKILSSGQALLGTEALLAEAVRVGALSMAKGDELLGKLTQVRYRPRVRSLRELI